LYRKKCFIHSLGLLAIAFLVNSPPRFGMVLCIQRNPRMSFTVMGPFLADIRSIFAASDAQRLFSTTLVHSLAALPNRTGSAISANHSPLNQTSLACRLRVFNVLSHNVRIGDIQAKGYDLADFAEPFALFLDNQPPNA